MCGRHRHEPPRIRVKERPPAQPSFNSFACTASFQLLLLLWSPLAAESLPRALTLAWAACMVTEWNRCVNACTFLPLWDILIVQHSVQSSPPGWQRLHRAYSKVRLFPLNNPASFLFLSCCWSLNKHLRSQVLSWHLLPKNPKSF